MSWRGRIAFMFVLASVAVAVTLATAAGAKPLPHPIDVSALTLPDGVPATLAPSIVQAIERSGGAAGGILQIGSDYNLSNGAQLPVQQVARVSAWFSGAGNGQRLEFQYSPVGRDDWRTFATLNGSGASGSFSDGSGRTFAAVTIGPDVWMTTVGWDTRGLDAGSYELRAVVSDPSTGRTGLTTNGSTATLDVPAALRAYIEPTTLIMVVDQPNCSVSGSAQLFAQVFIYDLDVTQVEFQYSADGGQTWNTIGIWGDDAFERKGDVTLRAGILPFSTVAGSSHSRLNNQFGGRVKYWDADANGYSSVDPMVLDNNNNGQYDVGEPVANAAGAPAPIPPQGTPLATFTSDIYTNVNPPNFEALAETQYIMQDNRIDGESGADVWMWNWDLTGLTGNLLVRAVATDNLNNVDNDQVGAGIPTTSLTITDTDFPAATITSLTLQDGTVVTDFSAPVTIAATMPWFYVSAEPVAGVTDVAMVRFEWSSNGGASWSPLDVNDDNDFFTDLNGNHQFDPGVDETFLDTDNSGTYTAGDALLNPGFNNHIDTPIGTIFATLYPLVGEDPNDNVDNDGDGKCDEDAFNQRSDNSCAPGVVIPGQSPEDLSQPFMVPFPYRNIFNVETTVLFRAVATDTAGHVACGPFTPVSAVLQIPPIPPQADVVAAVAGGDTLDIESVLRGDVICLDADATPLNVLVAAENPAMIQDIDLYYRVAPMSLPGFDPAFPDTTPWIAAGIPDATYPFEFSWNLAGLPDGIYEFFARAVDINGVPMPPLENPYRFWIQRNTATLAAPIFFASNLPAVQGLPGDVLALSANMTVPDVPGQVCFYYAGRIEESITPISATFPFVGQLSRVVFPGADGQTEIVTIGGQPGIFIAPDQFDNFPAKTFQHYTIRGNVIEFGAAIPAGTDVTVAYNFTPYTLIGCDVNAPYSLQWTVPNVAGATQFDVIAGFVAGPVNGITPCAETLGSEGVIFRLTPTRTIPFMVNGIHDLNGNGVIEPAENWPGNALCVTQGLGFDNATPTGTQVNKLSGDWAEIFVTVGDLADTAAVDLVTLAVAHTFDGDPTTVRVMTEVPTGSTLDQVIHKTLDVRDLTPLNFAPGVLPGNLAIDPAKIENIEIHLWRAGAPSIGNRILPMNNNGTDDDLVAGDNVYTARLLLPGDHYQYEFVIHLANGTVVTVNDPRNEPSLINIPAAPYWWTSARLDDGSLFTENQINHVHVNVRATDGTITTNLSPGNPIGQIDVILDRTGPIFTDVLVNPSLIGPAGATVQMFATVTDPHPADINIIGVDAVEFQVSRDVTRTSWVKLGPTDTDPSDGWSVTTAFPFDPSNDGIDNDGDGLFDETDEGVFTYVVRAVAVDDCSNTTYSTAFGFTDSLVVDVLAPSCELVQPDNGQIFTYGSQIPLLARAALDSLGAPIDTDINYVLFQVDIGNGWQALDATPGNDNDLFDGFPGNETPGRIDTPTTWNSSILTETDMYVRFRCISRDLAGNFSHGLNRFNLFSETGADGEAIEYVTVLINDNTAPFAALTEVTGSGLSFCAKSIVDPSLTLGDQVVLTGIATYTPLGDVAAVMLQYSIAGATGPWIDAAVDNNLQVLNSTQKSFSIPFNTRNIGLPDEGGFVWLRVAALDHDGNMQSDLTRMAVVRVRVDNTTPDLTLVRVGPAGNGSDAVPDSICVQYDNFPAEATRGNVFDCGGDCAGRLDNVLTFEAADVTDASVDLIDFVFLQFLDNWTDPANPVWRPQLPAIPALDADQNGVIDPNELAQWNLNRQANCSAIQDFLEENSQWKFSFRDSTGNDNAPDGRWFLQFNGNCNFTGVQALKDAMISETSSNLPDGTYRFRALAVDYAGNISTNDQGVRLHIDTTPPTVERIFVGTSEMEGGGDGTGTVHVGAGDRVPLAALVTDGPESCGIFGVQFQYSLSGSDEWNVIPGAVLFNAATNIWELQGDWLTPLNIGATDSLYAIRAVAVDNAGNCGSTVRDEAVSLQDVTAPTATRITGITGDCVFPAEPNEETVNSPAGTSVSGIVTLFAMSQAGDLSMNPDVSGPFRPTVFFEARPAGSTDGWTTVCSSQEAVLNSDGRLVWNCQWDTRQAFWADGVYEVRARGRDAWGNTEIRADNDIALAIRVTVTNDDLVVRVDAIPGGGIDRTATIERNDCRGFTFTAVTDPLNLDISQVTFWYKLSTDLNVPESWKMVGPGLNSNADFNPDTNRPFSFTWDTNRIADCGGTLIPGQSYDIVAAATALVAGGNQGACNELTAVEAFAADLGITVQVVDTIAPRAVITELVRNAGDTDPIKFPEDVHVNSFAFIQATIQPGVTVNGTVVDSCAAPRDVQRVQFWFTQRTNGTAPAFSPTTWTLAGGDVNLFGADSWRLSNWSSDLLPEGAYWFAAVAQDCFGNVDTAPAAISIVIDRTCPTFTAVNPVDFQKFVPEISSPNPVDRRLVDLIVRATGDVVYTSPTDNSLQFEYRPSEAPDSAGNWFPIASAVVRNGGTAPGDTATYAASLNLNDLVNRFNQCQDQSGLYDFRVRARDLAGNNCTTVFAHRVVVDNTAPQIEITSAQFLNPVGPDTIRREDLTFFNTMQDTLRNISSGERIRLFVTASDDEPCIPPSQETRVFEVQFYLGTGPDGGVHYPQNLGTAGFDSTTGQWSIVWNTSGLADGVYTLFARGEDEARNIGTSEVVYASVSNPARPLAQIVGFNPDLVSDLAMGNEGRIYGLSFGEDMARLMFFQYTLTQPTLTTNNWVTFGAATNTGEILDMRSLQLPDQSLWYSSLVIDNFPDNQAIWFRAVAVDTSVLGLFASGELQPASMEVDYYGRLNPGQELGTNDGTPGDFSRLYDLENTPVLRMVKRTNSAGQAILVQEDAAVEDLIREVSTQGVDFSSNGLVTVRTNGAQVMPYVVLIAEDNSGLIDEAIPRLSRRIDDRTAWTGDIRGDVTNFEGIDPTEGVRIGVFASAHLRRTLPTDDLAHTDLDWKIWNIWQVTPGAGSNGWAGVDGNGTLVPLPPECSADNIPGGPYPADDFAVMVPPGAFNTNAGMLLDRVARPTTTATQDLYINVVGQSYTIRFMDSDWDQINAAAAGNGWLGRACIRYADSLVVPNEGTVSVRRWNGSEWTVQGLSHIDVDRCANMVCFNFDPEVIGSDNLVFSIVTGDQFSPVQVQVSPMAGGFTDRDPIFKAVLTNIHGGTINPGDISIYIRRVSPDSTGPLLVAQTRGTGSRWLLYAGSWLNVDQVDAEGNVIAITFGWTCEEQFGLTEGTYEFEVRFTDFARSEFFGVGQPFVFEVDRTPPTIIFNAGFVGNPLLRFAPAFVGTDSMVTVRLIDTGSGVLFREDRIDDDIFSQYWFNDVDDRCEVARYALLFNEWFEENNIPIQFDKDNSFKYDLWVADGEDDQSTVHEYEERHLLHTGTADELWPNIVHPAADSVLVNGVWYRRENVWDVPIFMVGGGAIQNGDAMSITLYSNRYETPPLNSLNEYLDQIAGQGGTAYGEGWWIDFSTKRLIQYARSIQDNVHNVGSRFLEQRFIVDTEAPTVEVTSPGVNCDGAAGVVTSVEPNTDYNFTAVITETGSGIDPGSVTVTINGPTRQDDEDGVTITNLVINDNLISFTIPKDQLLVGQYRITISGRDRLGNAFSKTCVLTVGGLTNELAGATAYPNPFDPKDTDVTLAFQTARQSNVRIAIYDWNGDKVRTIDAGSMAPGPQVVKWGGDAEDGTPLANGVYLARIESNDGRRTVTDVIKVAIWRD